MPYSIQRVKVTHIHADGQPSKRNPYGERITRPWQYEVSLNGEPVSYHNTRTEADMWMLEHPIEV